MKKLLSGIVMLLLVVTFVPSYVLAHEGEAGAETETETVETQQLSPEELAQKQAEKAAKLQERVQAYKEKLENKLSSVESKKITGVCKSAQTITAKLGSNVDRIRTNRENAYNKVTEKLTTVVEKVKLTGVDTTELEAALMELETEVDAFLSAIDEYQTLLNDLSEMDCEADPEAFRSALNLAKEKRVELVSSSQELRKHVIETIKPILNEIRAQLTAGTEDTTESESNTENTSEGSSEAETENNDTTEGGQ